MNSSNSSKRFRTEDSSINSNCFLSDDLIFCPFCTFNSNSQVDIDFHNHIHHQHQCSQCLHIFPSYFLLELHMDEIHNTYSTIQSYRCLIETCSKIFSNIDQRSQHINTEHYTKNYSLNKIYSLFSSHEQLIKMKNNDKDKKFGCDSQKTFLRNSRLKPREFLPSHWDGNDE
ncbi:unnamed protein product [Adineta steineri]|uniref:C2H2-type domain-containing protein n=2 Tax=Adineta steineri TaxID=433720 RepID=A0A814HY29_9BILA|nr:unnamed protein product [Adineta steineri]CAF1128632.1 unnamed protein product [Adineta steineri]